MLALGDSQMRPPATPGDKEAPAKSVFLRTLVRLDALGCKVLQFGWYML